MPIGEILKELRLALNLRQEDISKSAHVDQSKISRLERYNIMCNFDEICRIGAILGITPNQLWEKIKDEYTGIKPSSLGEEGGEKQQEKGA